MRVLFGEPDRRYYTECSWGVGYHCDYYVNSYEGWSYSACNLVPSERCWKHDDTWFYEKEIIL